MQQNTESSLNTIDIFWSRHFQQCKVLNYSSRFESVSVLPVPVRQSCSNIVKPHTAYDARLYTGNADVSGYVGIWNTSDSVRNSAVKLCQRGSDAIESF